MPSALVTGATGGIGRAICEVLAANGYRVFGLDRAAGECAALAVRRCDIRHFHEAPAQVAGVVTEIREFCGGRLDLLVNNAAHQVVKPFAELTNEDWAETLGTNLLAPMALAKTFLSELTAARGCVVNIGSIHAELTKPGFVAYATSKGALATMTRAMAVDLGEAGVRVNAILPAAIDTPMLRAGFEGNPGGYAQLEAFHPSGRIGRPQEIAELILFLGTHKADFINGAALEINGGIGGRLHDPV